MEIQRDCHLSANLRGNARQNPKNNSLVIHRLITVRMPEATARARASAQPAEGLQAGAVGGLGGTHETHKTYKTHETNGTPNAERESPKQRLEN
jgi:hypothetical protein